MADLNRQEEIKRQRIFTLQDAMQLAQVRLNDTTARKNSEQMELVKLETRREDLANDGYAELKQPPALWEKNKINIYAPEQTESVKDEITKLKYRLSLIGGIDEEVIKEYEETQSRFDGLSGQLHDLTKAASDIETLITELDAVMKKKHAAAFAKIRKEFARYFEILFEGGKADLVEVYGEPESDEGSDETEVSELESDEASKKKRTPKILTGIEVVAVPPGKKIKNIAALSGGERTLTSIALVSAILHTNPPPFVFLDEVEAALDEANTVRFNTILQELAVQSQFILITHNRATMHAADILYGVTMGADGVSKLLSVQLGATQAPQAS
jgi:chromosome segregation protein